MTVAELMEMLEACDPEAVVRIMSQEGWPFENGILGVVVRDELAEVGCTCDRRINEPHGEECEAWNEDETYGEGRVGNDVFIVEGQQERYGDKRAWEIA